MRYFSLFSGIGGFELGIGSRAECVGYSEIDKYAVSVYQNHFPSHTNYGDITTIDARLLPDFDLLVGGFPCQSFSIAGKRGGFADTRGTLFFEIRRLIRSKRPRLLLLENVKGLLSHDGGATFATIISTLDELGYDLQWQVLNSKDYGVPQNRERIFIAGHSRGTPRPEVFPFTDAAGKDIASLNDARHDYDRIYEVSGIAPTLNTGQRGNAQPKIHVPEATKKGYAEATVGQAINLAVPASKTRRGRVSDIANTLDTGMQQHTLTEDMRIRRLTPTECERLQGFPDGWTEGVSDSQRYKCLGNAVTVNVIEAIASRMI